MAVAPPVILDLGKKSKKQLKKLKSGSGKLMESVQKTLAELQAQNAISDAVQPVIVVIQKKSAKKGMLAAISGM